MQQIQVPSVTLVNLNQQQDRVKKVRRNRQKGEHQAVSSLLHSSEGTEGSSAEECLNISSPSTRLSRRNTVESGGSPRPTSITEHLVHTGIIQNINDLIVEGKRSVGSAASSNYHQPRRSTYSNRRVGSNGRVSKDQTTETDMRINSNGDLHFDGNLLGEPLRNDHSEKKPPELSTITMTGEKVGLKPYNRIEPKPMPATKPMNMALRTFTAGNEPFSPFENSEKQRNRNRNVFTTAPKQKRPSIIPQLDPLNRAINNPLVGPNGIKDLQTLLNAPIDNYSSTQRQQSSLRTASAFRQSNFHKRATSLGPTTPGHHQKQTNSDKYSRSQSTARSSTQHNQRLPQQQFGMVMPLNMGLLQKIRQGVGLPVVPATSATKDQTRQRTIKQECSDLKASQSQSVQEAISSAKESAKKNKFSSKRNFDYCPDEDSDNDIYTLQVNCAPGTKCPESKPNNPKKMHTTRQVDKIVDNYIQRLEKADASPPKRTHRLKELSLTAAKKGNQSREDRGKDNPPIYDKLDNNSPTLSPTSLRSTTFSKGFEEYKAAINKRLAPAVVDPQQQITQQQHLLKITPGKPKYSFDFNKWMEKQKKEDPALLSNMESILKPHENRDLQDVQDAQIIQKIATRQQLKLRGKKPISPSFQFGIQEGVSQPISAFNFVGQVTSRRATIDTSRTMPISEEYEPVSGPFTSREVDGGNQSTKGLPPSDRISNLGNINIEDMDSPAKLNKNQSVDGTTPTKQSSQRKKQIGDNSVLSFKPSSNHNSKHHRDSINKLTTAYSDESKASRLSAQIKLPITEMELKHQKMYHIDEMLTHERRALVFDACQNELLQYKSKRQETLLSGGRIASKTLRVMLGVYWKEFFKKERRKHTGTTKEEDLKQSEETAREAVLRRLERMSSYVDQVEGLINQNPISRRKLIDEAFMDASMVPTETEAANQDVIRTVILRKLKEATDEINDQADRRTARLDKILTKYGSVQAYKDYLLDLKRQYAEDRESMIQKEKEAKAQAEAAQRKKSEKNSMENQLKVTRWMNNYDQIAVDIVEKEIDVLNDMNKEEMLAGLCLIQDDAIDEHNSYLIERGELDDLILTIRSEVNDLKKTLKATKSAKIAPKAAPRKTSKAKQLLKEKQKQKILKGGGSVDSQLEGKSIVTGAQIDISIENSISDDNGLERDSQQLLSDDDDSDTQALSARHNRQKHAASRRRLQSHLGSSMDSVTSSSIQQTTPQRPADQRSKSLERRSGVSQSTASQLREYQSNLSELKRQKKRDLRKKLHKARKRWLKKTLKKDMLDMEDHIFELQEKVEEFGLDCFVSGVEVHGKQKVVKAPTSSYNAENQLTSKLDKLFETKRPGVKWEDEEQKFLEQTQARAKPNLTKSMRGILSRTDKPHAVKVFEEKCMLYNEKAPAIFKGVKSGKFSLREITLTPGQTTAFTHACEHFQGFADKIRLENNNIIDSDLSDIIQALTEVPQIKQLALVRNDLGDQSIQALAKLINKRFPFNLDHLVIEGIKMKPYLTKSLMNGLQGSNLRQLTLIQLNMNEESFGYFVTFMEKCMLEELDLRDSRVTSSQFSILLEILRKNKTIKFLNLKDNNLVPQGATIPGSFGNVGTSLDPIAEEGAGPESIITTKMNLKQQTLLENLSVFIRRNKKLLHLNLENTGLTYEMLKALLTSIKRSRSLQAIHLCGNPGVNEIRLIHDTVEMLDPINFSEWDDIIMAGRSATQSRTRRTMNSALTNKVAGRGSSMSPSRIQQSAKQLPVLHRNSSRQVVSPPSEEPRTPQVAGSLGGGILKKKTNFGTVAKEAETEVVSDSSDEKRERERKQAPSVLDVIHKGLGTKKYKKGMQERKKSSRLEVYEMERKGNKSVTFEQMKQSVQLLSHKKFIITRFIGHKVTSEHSHRWRLYLENTSNLNCWICEKWTYTVFFWTKQFGETDQIKLTSTQMQEFEEKKRCLELYVPRSLPEKSRAAIEETKNAENNLLRVGGLDDDMTGQIRKYNHRCPVMTGSYSNWEEPARMIRIKDFCHYIEKHKVEFFTFLKSKKMINDQVSRYQDLSEKDKTVYQANLGAYIDKYEPEKWKRTLAEKLKYRRPGLINLFDMDTFMSEDLWVTASFVKPGTHTYVVSDFRSDRKEYHHQNIHECIIGPREEEIVQFDRITKLRKGDVFHRYKTIFAPWPVENDPVFRQCIEHDVKLWKVTRLIKDGDDYNDTVKMLIKNGRILQHLFMYLSSKSVFPAIGLLDFGIFCNDSRIIDGKFISSTVDRQFIAATTANPGAEDNPKLKDLKAQASKAELIKLKPDSALVRYQFLEILVRIAGLKYRGQTFTPFKKPPEQIETYARAVEVLIEENITALYNFDTPEIIRMNRLWKNDVAGIFKANENLLQQLFKKMHKRKKFLDFDGTYEMVKKVEQAEMTQQTGLSQKDFTQLYAMSKQVVTQESYQGLQYLRTKFLEMVELIGRLTIFKNLNSQLEDLPMHKQVQLMMDELFELHLGCKSFEMGANEDESSGDSEDDY